jgi:hypothetical protein
MFLHGMNVLSLGNSEHDLGAESDFSRQDEISKSSWIDKAQKPLFGRNFDKGTDALPLLTWQGIIGSLGPQRLVMTVHGDDVTVSDLQCDALAERGECGDAYLVHGSNKIARVT